MALIKARVRKWIKLLESGEFKQARGALRTENGHCCLGIACELYSVEVGGFWGGEFDPTEFVADYNLNGEDSNGALLPTAVQKWLGITEQQEGELVLANDGGKSFKEIAQTLRAWIKK